MAIFINQNKKIKSLFVNVNGEKKSISSVWVNKDGVPTKVFQSTNSENDSYEIAPENEYNDWNYTLDETNDVITLNYYEGSAPNVIVYASYKINGRIYKTKLASIGENGTTVNKYMFYNKLNIETIKFSKNIDTSNVTDMRFMFYLCRSLISLDLSSFDTSNVTDMSYMFSSCTSLASLDLSSFDTSNVTNMRFMFRNCTSLASLDLSSFDTSNVTNMASMFYDCTSLTNPNLSGFNTSNVTDMSYMFRNCTSLTNPDLSSFDTSNVTNMGRMFYLCGSLISLDLSSFDTSNVTDMSYMFSSCILLKTIYVTNEKWSTSKATKTGMFTNCGTSLVTYK